MAIKYKPDYASAYINLGIVLKNQGKVGVKQTGFRLDLILDKTLAKTFSFKTSQVFFKTNLQATTSAEPSPTKPKFNLFRK